MPSTEPGMHYEAWGAGDPVIALHPLALDSTAFAGVARALEARGFRTLAADLPGFGRTPAPGGPLTPARLAAPVIALARELERPPLLLGMSLGGRVALEAALSAPEALRGVVAVAPYLPWRRWRRGFAAMRFVNPRWAERFPLEWVWPLLKRAADRLERTPALEHDWLARAAARAIYTMSCPATRVAVLSATREMTLDPAFGPESVWERLSRLELPATFVWAGRDALVPLRHCDEVIAALPAADQVEVPCSGHFVSGAHYRCMRHAMVLAVDRTLAAASAPAAQGAHVLAPCLADAGDFEEENTAAEAAPGPARTRGRNGRNAVSQSSGSGADVDIHVRRLSGEDAIFVYGETPKMPMHTMGTLILDPAGVRGGFDYARVLATLAARVHRMPPFRQRLLEVPLGLGHPLLVDDPEFRVENHLHRLAVPGPGGLRELAELVGELAGRPLDRGQPLWEMWMLEGLAGGRIALVTKMHHCMLDGASGSSQMAGLLDVEPDAPVAETPATDWRPPPLPSALSRALGSAGSGLVSPLRFARLLRDTASVLRRRARARRECARPDDERPGLFDTPPATPFNRALTTHRSVAYGSAPLDVVKRVKDAFGVTVNDAVLAAFAITLRRYLAARRALPERPLHCVVPISLKNEREKRQFSNKVSTLSILLPTHLEEPEAIVRAVQRETGNAKHVFQAADEDVLPAWLELVSPVLATAGVRLFSSLELADRLPPVANVILSNMMGPPIPLYFGGARVEAIYPMGPVGEGMGLNVTVLSNMGRLDVGVLACRECVPDPWEIADGFAAAVAELERAAAARAPAASARERVRSGTDG